MGFRFRRSVRLFPGVRLNIGKRGVSASVGIRGARRSGKSTLLRLAAGITLPDSGAYWLLGWVAGTIAGCVLLAAFFPQLRADLALATWGPALAAVMWTAHRIVRELGRAATTRADRQAQVDAERRYTEQTGFVVVHPP